MSGIETITLGVLGVLPLVISAAEHYNECHQAFVRYRKFAAEVDRFQQHLKIQKTVFRNQCRILLGNVTTVSQQDAASSMLGEPSHPLWADPETEQQVVDYLKDSREACLTVIELIESRLECVEKESHSLGAIVDEKQGVGRSYFSKLGQR
jgi:tRNA G26 N,N-dimethylase Trm1